MSGAIAHLFPQRPPLLTRRECDPFGFRRALCRNDGGRAQDHSAVIRLEPSIGQRAGPNEPAKQRLQEVHMMRRSYPYTSDPAILEAQRGAAMARSIAAIAVVCGVIAMFALTVRDVQRTDAPRAGLSPVVTTAASVIPPESLGTSPSATVAGDSQPRVESSANSEYSEYPSTF
jgi:hypothetical protein